MSTDSQQLQSRIDDLEYKVAFQEETIDTLNNALSEQQLQLSKMQEQMQFIVGKLRSMSSSNMADESEETPPPHY
jgi:SlyX protein